MTARSHTRSRRKEQRRKRENDRAYARRFPEKITARARRRTT